MLKKIISWADNRLNPVAVKELRQSTNSRVLTTLVIAFLAVQLFFLYLQIFLNDATSFDKRQVIFPTVLMVLVGACIYGIIPSISNRFFKELNGDSIDLIYTTVLSPFAIISGKTLSAIGMIILLYSLCAPFIFISYLFPGIDILTIFWSLWYSFWIIVSVSQLMILVAAMKTSKIMRGIILLIYFGGISIFGIGFLQSMSFGLGRTGIFGYGLVPFLRAPDIFAVLAAADRLSLRPGGSRGYLDPCQPGFMAAGLRRRFLVHRAFICSGPVHVRKHSRSPGRGRGLDDIVDCDLPGIHGGGLRGTRGIRQSSPPLYSAQ